ncbi:MAG: hypothetical protein ACXW3Z_06795, partial [Limisphaerales bacterium]
MNRAKKKKTAAETVLRESFLGLFLPYQQEWLRDRRQFKIGLWARQTGKDYTCAAEAALDCIVEKQKHWLILACGERQAIESLEKAREWVRIIQQHLRKPGRRPVARCTRESATEIRFDNGSRITALPARPGTVRG